MTYCCRLQYHARNAMIGMLWCLKMAVASRVQNFCSYSDEAVVAAHSRRSGCLPFLMVSQGQEGVHSASGGGQYAESTSVRISNVFLVLVPHNLHMDTYRVVV